MKKPECCGQCKFLQVSEETLGCIGDEEFFRWFKCGIGKDDVEAFLTGAQVPYDCPIKWEDDENEAD